MNPVLDDPAAYRARDPRGFADLLRGFARQVAEAPRLADGLCLGGALPREVLVAGMGGSALAGDLLHALAHDRAPFAVHVLRGYTVPAWVGPTTLVVGSSYSGSTEETLAAFEAARARGARGVVVASGGPLSGRAAREGLPWIRVPPGLPPRAALAYLLLPLVALLEAAGAPLGGATEREEAVAVLAALGAEVGPEVPTWRNPAKELATWLEGRRPVVYGTDRTAAAAYRWQTQLLENAKVVAFSGALPEVDHNAIEAWAAEPGGEWGVVWLRDPAEHPRVARRAVLTRALLEARLATREVWARGEGRLARLLSLVHLGDWVSYYLAILRGADPWAIETLERFKRRMAADGRPAASDAAAGDAPPGAGPAAPADARGAGGGGT